MSIDLRSRSAESEPRARSRAAMRIGIVAQGAVAAAGAYGLWEAHLAGRPVSRPSVIAFWAGLAGLVASVAAPRIRAFVRERRGS